MAEIARVTVALSCGPLLDGVPPQPLVPPGAPLAFDIELKAADGTALTGDTLHSVDDAAFTQRSPRSFLWSAPPGGGSVTFGSPLDPEFSQTLSTYASGDVTAIHAAIGLPQPLVLAPGQGMDFQLAADVGSRRACGPPEITVRTNTPSVCTGEQGALTWTAGGGSTEAWFTTLSEGTCRLAFAVPGGDRDLGTLDVPYYLVDSTNLLGRDQSAGEPCAGSNLHTCARDRASVLVCRSKRWAIATPCSPGICDYTAPAAACPDPAGCAVCR